MPPRLDELSPDLGDAILTHPMQLEAMTTIAQLISRLRGSTGHADLYDFQQDLLATLLAVEEHRGGCSRIVKRFESGKRLPADAVELRGVGDPNDLASWEVERVVCDRIGRQLRAVGDALAWRVFDFRRNFIIVLSRNQPPGPMAGKAGLTTERQFLHDTWHDRGRFAILHDLTSCLRIGDATVFEPDYVVVSEIKTSERHRSAAQERRIAVACEALRSHTPMPGGQVAVEIDVPYRTHLSALRAALDLARERKIQAMKVPGGRALVAASILGGLPAPSGHESAAIFGETLRSVRRRAAIADDDHITMRSVDHVGRAASSPPWSIYPLTPETCANLIADVAFFYVSLSGRRVLGALDRQGLIGEWLQPLDQSVDYVAPVLQVTRIDAAARRGRRMTMNPSELNRLLLELVDLDVWAESIAVTLSRQDLGEIAPWPYFVNENEVWT